ncbi:hypothetical protein [Streptantibioticus silvisoli]|uniref:Uncharacterized protein n=1 Tax=Streptantibioticus silvisoli TaxID=2705255 RepID=A0ABT6W5Y8_9ACTN|nr:hypothetical protein [Streptantibioticus silvisoli]MDI5964926.1 hypothetical protein [Streptantibioticus silvisoli]
MDLPTAVLWGATARMLARDGLTMGRILHARLRTTGRRLLGYAVRAGLEELRRPGPRTTHWPAGRSQHDDGPPLADADSLGCFGFDVTGGR